MARASGALRASTRGTGQGGTCRKWCLAWCEGCLNFPRREDQTGVEIDAGRG